MHVLWLAAACVWISEDDSRRLCVEKGWCDTGATTAAPDDTGTPPSDSGTTPADSDTTPIDSGGTPTDSGTSPTDSGGQDCDEPSESSVAAPRGFSDYADADGVIEGRSGILSGVGDSWGAGDFDGDCRTELVLGGSSTAQGGGSCPWVVARFTVDDLAAEAVSAASLPTGWAATADVDPAANCGTAIDPTGLPDLLGSGVATLAVTLQLPDETRLHFFDGWADGATVDDAYAALTPSAEASERTNTFVSGDFDGDGVQDVAVGEPTDGRYFYNQGRVYLFSGAPAGSADIGDVSATLTPGTLSEDLTRLGGALAVCDIDGDGVDELIAGLRGERYPGDAGPQVGIFALSDALSVGSETVFADAAWNISLSHNNDRVDAIACGPLDASGRPSLVIGSRTTQADEVQDPAQDGAVFIFSAPVQGDTPWQRFRTDAATRINGELDASLGFSLALPGDVDGDGESDLFLGATGAASGKSTATLLYGPIPENTHSLADLDDDGAVFFGENQTGVGRNLGAVGDLGGDGHPELADAHAAWGDAGAVFLWLGGPAVLE